jgi:nucleoside-diphosphate-sugar epimerase
MVDVVRETYASSGSAIRMTTGEDSSRGNEKGAWIAGPDDHILVTGAGGFIGTRVVGTLLNHGFKKIRCFVKPSSTRTLLQSISAEFEDVELDFVEGNLLSMEDCRKAAAGVSVIYHLAAGRGKTFPGCFLNSVVTTRNLLEAAVKEQTLKRFVNISSLSVYSNDKIRRGSVMDESCEEDPDLVERHDPYAYGKAKQDEIVREYGRTKGLHYVIVRPGNVFGPGKVHIPGRVGIDSFGVFLHLGLNNRLPLTYVDNCAEAIVLAGLREGMEGEIINVVDDDLPSSREYVRFYKRQVQGFTSIPVPYALFYFLNYLWERYSNWSAGQLPPVFNRKTCAAYYKGNTYPNRKAKELLGWYPRVRMSEGLQRYFDYVSEIKGNK